LTTVVVVAPKTSPPIAIGSHTRRGGGEGDEDHAASYVGAPSWLAAIDVVAALVDGMGGAKGARVGVELAVRGLIDGCTGVPITLGVPQISAPALHSVNRWRHILGGSDGRLNEMACELGALVLCGRGARLLHVGDSRICRLRDDQIRSLTTDHTVGGFAVGGFGITNVLARASCGGCCLLWHDRRH
jgi:serine/threonine protein phosphatase PrpC